MKKNLVGVVHSEFAFVKYVDTNERSSKARFRPGIASSTPKEKKKKRGGNNKKKKRNHQVHATS